MFWALPAMAAGFGLKEHSADAMAAAYAGAAATDNEASYLAYNPASLAGVSDMDGAISLVAILPGSKSSYRLATTSAGTPTGGNTAPQGFISDAVVPAFDIRARLTDRWAIGLSLTAPWGLSTNYSTSWAGRYYARKTNLITINAAPTVSYQLSDRLAVGAGLQIEYAHGKLTSVIDTGTLGALNSIPGAIPGAQDSFATLRGSDWAVGYTAGVIDHVTNQISVGLSYRSAVRHKLSGPLTFDLDSAGIGATIRALTGLFSDTHQNASLTMPAMVLFGARTDISERWSTMLEVDWTQWSSFKELRAVAANPLQPDDITVTRWKNAVFGSVGVEYRAAPSWTLRAGVAYDQSPIPDATREPRIPDADRIWLSAGINYRMNDHANVKLSAAHLFVMKSKIALNPTMNGNALRGTLVGSTESYVNVVGLEVTYRTD